ncbi:LINE-1 retrotransposable element ORF2 protein [Camelus dromedarius]|uniref:LINE-1 retrotransposable element ORF2 protein n=1 Tax=Camelus dromedarius TaxID=9838 RepID=A0A5N4CHE8_CAMDR|nr:LINE-1 retrotransposable element ORF2 protein [Camelus dromedarius]
MEVLHPHGSDEEADAQSVKHLTRSHPGSKWPRCLAHQRTDGDFDAAWVWAGSNTSRVGCVCPQPAGERRPRHSLLVPTAVRGVDHLEDNEALTFTAQESPTGAWQELQHDPGPLQPPPTARMAPPCLHILCKRQGQGSTGLALPPSIPLPFPSLLKSCESSLQGCPSLAGHSGPASSTLNPQRPVTAKFSCISRTELRGCSWECSLAQPSWKTVWRFFQRLKIDLPYDPAIPLLSIYPEGTLLQKDTCTPMFIAALFTIATTWKQCCTPAQPGSFYVNRGWGWGKVGDRLQPVVLELVMRHGESREADEENDESSVVRRSPKPSVQGHKGRDAHGRRRVTVSTEQGERLLQRVSLAQFVGGGAGGRKGPLLQAADSAKGTTIPYEASPRLRPKVQAGSLLIHKWAVEQSDNCRLPHSSPLPAREAGLENTLPECLSDVTATVRARSQPGRAACTALRPRTLHLPTQSFPLGWPMGVSLLTHKTSSVKGSGLNPTAGQPLRQGQGHTCLQPVDSLLKVTGTCCPCWELITLPVMQPAVASGSQPAMLRRGWASNLPLQKGEAESGEDLGIGEGAETWARKCCRMSPHGCKDRQAGPDQHFPLQVGRRGRGPPGSAGFEAFASITAALLDSF